MKAIKRVGTVIAASLITALVPVGVFADAADRNVLTGVNSIDDLLNLIVDILVYGLGAAATIGVVIAGILYLTARDNPQQAAKAKTRLIEIAIGLGAWAAMYALLRFLLPGYNG